MGTISVSAEANNKAAPVYRARAKGREAFGDTIGRAIDGLPSVVGDGNSLTVVFVQSFQPDRFFTADQQNRLIELRDKARSAHESGGSLPPDEQRELTALIDAELRGATERSAEILQQIKT